MEFFKRTSHFDFMGKRWLFFGVSVALILVSIVSFAVRGMNFGIDFTGGTIVEVGYSQPIALDEVRDALATRNFNDVQVLYFGTSKDVLIRLPPEIGESQSQLSNQVLDVLRAHTDDQVKLNRVEFIGPQVGDELREDGGLAVLYALIGILLYVALRFEYRFSVGAVAATVHDIIITVGFFSLFQIQFDLTVLAAVLAILGYSLNDTIVVFDRIRENFRRMRKATTAEIINASVNQTLSRTIMTSAATLVVVIALYFLGGEVLRGFSTALIVGILIGTYSSIYVASTYVLILGVSKADMMPVKKEGAELGGRP